jgi:hypothetical protein
MGLSGSALAKASYEKDFVIWLLARDQDFIGVGTIGFDLCEMPWSIRRFYEEKSFLLNMANGVKSKIGWSKLSYAPNEEMLFSCIDEFISLIEEFQIEDVDENYRLEWIKEGNPLYRQGSGIWVSERNSYEWVEGEIHHEIQGYAKCLKHGLFLTYFGCHLCKS